MYISAFTLKEGPVRCAKVCNKSWVILTLISDIEKASKPYDFGFYMTEILTFDRLIWFLCTKIWRFFVSVLLLH